MKLDRLTLTVLAAGVGLALLSAAPYWLVQRRILMGEGARLVVSGWNAWQGDAMPMVSAGVILACGASVLALARASRGPASRGPASRGPAIPAWLVAVIAAAALGVLLAATWPLQQQIGASSINLSAGISLVAGIGLAAVLAAAAAVAARPSRVVVACIVAALVLGIAAGVGGRVVGLTLRKAATDGRGGVYARAATEGQPAETLTMRDGVYSAGDRWSGTFVRSGITIVFLDDPACPDTRGSYHVLPADEERGGDQVRLDAILDLCAEGERARDLETGVWVRQE